MMNTIIVGEAIFQGEAPSRHHLIGKICHTLLKPEVQTHHVISVIIILSAALFNFDATQDDDSCAIII